MKTRWLVLLGVLVFAYTLVLHAPVALLYGHLRPATSPVELTGLSGRVSQGSAAGVLLRGQTAVRDLHWKFRPWELLLGRAGFRVSGNGEGLVLDGRLALRPGGLDLRDFRASGSVKPLLSAAGLFLPVDGMLGLELQRLALDDGYPTRAEGRLALDGLAWKLGRDPMPLGDFEAVFAPDADGLAAQIRSLRGPLEVSGQAQLKADRSYDLDLQLRPKGDAPPPLVNMLRSLGPPDTQANYHLRRRGQFAAAAVHAVPEASE